MKGAVGESVKAGGASVGFMRVEKADAHRAADRTQAKTQQDGKEPS